MFIIILSISFSVLSYFSLNLQSPTYVEIRLELIKHFLKTISFLFLSAQSQFLSILSLSLKVDFLSFLFRQIYDTKFFLQVKHRQHSSRLHLQLQRIIQPTSVIGMMPDLHRWSMSQKILNCLSMPYRYCLMRKHNCTRHKNPSAL